MATTQWPKKYNWIISNVGGKFLPSDECEECTKQFLLVLDAFLTLFFFFLFDSRYNSDKKISSLVAEGIHCFVHSKCSSTVWPDVWIKSSPNVSKSCPKRSLGSFCLKMDVFKMAHNVIQYLSNYCTKIYRRELSKIAQSGHSVPLSGTVYLFSTLCNYLGTIALENKLYFLIKGKFTILIGSSPNSNYDSFPEELSSISQGLIKIIKL